jgi:hypothetical protein
MARMQADGQKPRKGEWIMVRLPRVRKARKGILGRAARKLEDRFLVRVGRKAVRERMTRVGQITRKAGKAGLIVGTLVAATVVRREVRKRRQKV